MLSGRLTIHHLRDDKSTRCPEPFVFGCLEFLAELFQLIFPNEDRFHLLVLFKRQAPCLLVRFVLLHCRIEDCLLDAGMSFN